MSLYSGYNYFGLQNMCNKPNIPQPIKCNGLTSLAHQEFSIAPTIFKLKDYQCRQRRMSRCKISVLIQSLKSSILSSTSFRLDKCCCRAIKVYNQHGCSGKRELRPLRLTPESLQTKKKIALQHKRTYMFVTHLSYLESLADRSSCQQENLSDSDARIEDAVYFSFLFSSRCLIFFFADEKRGKA